MAAGWYSLTSLASTNSSSGSGGGSSSTVGQRLRVAVAECEPGHYCVNGVKHACPLGR